MKVAVTSSGRSLNSPVDSRFGRAPYFILVDTETGAWEAYDNEQNVNAQQGAGVQAAETVSQAGAQLVITGHCGPKAFKTLQAAGIQVVVGANGTVADAVAAFKSGKLQVAERPNAESHWA